MNLEQVARVRLITTDVVEFIRLKQDSFEARNASGMPVEVPVAMVREIVE
ncbi:hypothetical protein [Paenibacillus sp. NRS-1760]